MYLLERVPFRFIPRLAAENRGCEGVVPPHTQRLQRERLNSPDLYSGASLFLVDITSCLSGGSLDDPRMRILYGHEKTPRNAMPGFAPSPAVSLSSLKRTQNPVISLYSFSLVLFFFFFFSKEVIMAFINVINEVLHRIRVKLYPNYLLNVEGAYLARTINEAGLSVEDVCAALKNRGGFTGNYDDLVEHVKQYFGEAAY
jgi:hypothetical protein